MRGADLVAKSLKYAGVRTIFTLSGNQIMPIFDACIDADIHLVHVRHEAAAVFMADAWAQVTGEVGVALLTAGPGLANGLGPLFSARFSESPVLLLSGDSPLAQDGHGAFQELAQKDASTPLTKLSFRSQKTENLGNDIAKAFQVARSGRPGPVHLALPFDLLNSKIGETALPKADAFARLKTPLLSDAAQAFSTALANAKRPIVLTGPAMNQSRAGDALSDLSNALRVPVIAMESPRGLRDPSLGAVAEILSKADAVLYLGKALDFTTGFAKPPGITANSLLVIDPDAEQLDRVSKLLGKRLVIGQQADADLACQTLTDIAPSQSQVLTEWQVEVSDAIAYRGQTTPTKKISPWTVSAAVQELLDGVDDPILVVDGGEFGQWAQAFTTAKTRIINGISGAIGGSLCYAIGAKIACPDATVVAMMGDGTVGFQFAEFDTAVRERAAVTAVIGNDARWNAEHMIQLRNYGPDRLIGCQLNPAARYDCAAEGLGCHGDYITDEAELSIALERAIASGLPACINVEIESMAAPLFSRTDAAPMAGH